ncbi:hypothetical protein D3C72_1444040 [compost metagenome]
MASGFRPAVSTSIAACARRGRIDASASFSSDSGCTGTWADGALVPAASRLVRRSPTSWIRRITCRCRRRAVLSSKGRTPSCTASISARMAARGVRSSWATSPSHWRRLASMLPSCSAMVLKVRASWASSSLPCTATRVCRWPWAMPRAPVASASTGASQRRASQPDSSSASARPAKPVHATKPRCWARKAWSASLRTPWGGASTRWPMVWPSRPRSARRAPPGWGAVPATTRSWGSTRPRRGKRSSGCR